MKRRSPQASLHPPPPLLLSLRSRPPLLLETKTDLKGLLSAE